MSRPSSAEAPAPVFLVVDDEPTLLELMSRVLQRAGYPVLAVGDGDAALEAFGAQPQGVAGVVMDLRVRPRGGVAILEALLERSPGLAVVITSGSAPDAETRERLRAQGGRFGRKPFAPEQLLDAVRGALAPEHPEA